MSNLLLISIIILGATLSFLIIQTIFVKKVLYRVLNLDLFALTSIGLFLVIYFVEKNALYLDLALLLTFVSFITGLVFAIFLPVNTEREGK